MSRNYTSPYAKPLHQYPSQSEDYISLEIGGPGTCSTPARPHYNNLNTKGSGGNFYQNKQRGRGGQQNRFSGGWQSNRHSTSGYGMQWQQTPRNCDPTERQWRGGGHKQRNSRQSFNCKVKDVSAYVHKSMLEDPWKDLMERRDAIKRSEINLPTPAQQNYQIPTFASTEESDSEDIEADMYNAGNEGDIVTGSP
ncbi:uncharacterized protein LOC126762370 [Bactrocera neohumeralis]|uniref:uncharacterized protein LOC120782111 n=1 Tax=Bactrocera tryoni TaxID=59916 RepID=UPI001A97B2CE|nr:uncharacterized protein LOC120782111 [Bactrocera tryoni]XP_050335046.1 uncharacterized protein LOC126762370 [Bactrocera neohumeralis]